jgi:hypothetical protein
VGIARALKTGLESLIIKEKKGKRHRAIKTTFKSQLVKKVDKLR